ncbi:DUF5999 family protein [Streptomyces collinus]|uniref:Uncharacterized protein n=1 Tax=Streptomyces collinus (strain DSM 40733 / Tue 365) TaxID=1214242 RepID=S5VPA1_STRC3|nr:DUF5999 family protein [Streptomyces collinus]AGS72377.1 hypothetical protein B446_27845 [Streptomyces collinus Tu 365]UJA11036.1 hypothetical protein HGI10_50110 [Streptomyces collinus]UJA14100.1 hypothetical protein HGI09_14010 [Streptomyces collinus]
MCSCPISSTAVRAGVPHLVTARPEQGWALLCDGSIVFDDSGELHPDGSVVPPRRVPAERLAVAA